MITKDQIIILVKKYKTNESTVLREYLQILFLSKLYSSKESNRVFFKGGTAIHLLFGAPRFSEDLDFTVNLSQNKFTRLITNVFKNIIQEEEVTFKERKTITGKRFLLKAKPTVLPYSTFINLDFSFREKVLQETKSVLATEYPITFHSFVYHLTASEIAAEKIRAIFTRDKGRDLYDLWYLLTKGVIPNNKLIREKLKYYHISNNEMPIIIHRIKQFPEKEFILDLRPFVPINERSSLGEKFKFVKEYLINRLS